MPPFNSLNFERLDGCKGTYRHDCRIHLLTDRAVFADDDSASDIFRDSDSDDGDLPPKDSRYYYDDTHPTLAGSARAFVDKHQEEEIRVSNSVLPKIYQSEIRMSKIGKELKPGSFVCCLGTSLTGTVEKITKHRKKTSRIVTVRENVDQVAFDKGKLVYSGWSKKIKLTKCKAIFREGIYIRKKTTKQWFKVKKAGAEDTRLLIVFNKKDTSNKDASGTLTLL